MRRLATVRARTTLLATAAAGLTLVAAAVALLLVLESQLTSSGDELSRARLSDVLALAEEGRLPARVDPPDDESVVQVVAADGRVLAASPNVLGRPAIMPPAAADGPDDQDQPATVEGPDDDETERYRVWAGRGPSPEGDVTVLVGRSLESVDEATRTLRGALLAGVPVVVALIAIGTWLVVGRALQRVDDLTRTVAGIDEAQLALRVPVPDVDDEVSRLAATMNRMLQRLEDARDRERAFVADASHELQSPLAAQRALLEVALAAPEGSQVDGLARELLGSVSEMEALVRDLLFLARIDAGPAERPPPDQLPLVDLDTIVLEETARARQVTTVGIDTSEVSAAPVRGHPGDLRRLVRNLLENAVRYAAHDVRVVLALRGPPEDRTAQLEVVDDGPGISPADAERVFDRFYQGDPARPRGRRPAAAPGVRPAPRPAGSEDRRPGTGLGLAIARDVARRYGGDLVAVPADAGAHLRVRLPAG